MAQTDVSIADLADRLGIASHYLDQDGVRVDTGDDVRRAIIEALGFPASDAADVRHSLERVTARASGVFPPWTVIDSGRAANLPAQGRGGGPTAHWTLSAQGARIAEGRGDATLPPLQSGYYELHVEPKGGRVETSHVFAAPSRCHVAAPFDTKGQRGWGATAQVYGLRSRDDFGIGDFSDVARLASGAAAHGASFLGLSPLHALFTSDRSKTSPYSPSTRLFMEPLYIDPRAVDIDGFDLSDAIERHRAEIEDLRSRGLLDYAAAWRVKAPLLEALHRAFTSSARRDMFDARRAELGEALDLHATFEALSEHFAAQGLHWSGAWPEPYQNGKSQAVAAFRAEHRDRVSFHAWLQVVADRQLEAAATEARNAGMEIGLYRDLAVGADRFGSEAWVHPDRYALALSVGAPPDPLGPQGQNWGFPPFHPISLEDQGFAAFRDLVSANMRHSGALRIDHAYQLQRLFLVPPGRTAALGAYVSFPFDALIAILKIESHRHGCMVIAEDLGTGPQGFSDRIMDEGVLSYRILSFERGEAGSFKPPETYPRDALAAITTHDLPTFRGWLRGFDIDLRSCFGVYDEATADREHLARQKDVRSWRDGLHAAGLSGDFSFAVQARDEALQYLARTPSMLLAVQCEDALNELNQANLPGPSDGHPNWRRRLSGDVEHLVGEGGPLARIGALMADEGRTPRPRQSRLATAPPRATYRLQFHKGFTFAQAREIVPYLARLGVSHVYASPIQAAHPGSTHGYDVIDPRIVNPELGGEEDFDALVETLHAHGLKLLLDIVPNHMGTGAENPFWFSVLQWGPASPHAGVFDIDWARTGADGKIVLPLLGNDLDTLLDKSELQLAFDRRHAAFVIRYHETILPVSPRHYGDLLARASARLGVDSRAGQALRRMANAFSDILDLPDTVERADALSRGLVALCADQAVAEAVAAVCTSTDGDALRGLIEAQNWRAVHWRRTSSDLNYRRFFEINTLAGVRVEDEAVFEVTHSLILRLVAQKKVDGLRIDHIDGLAEPRAYLDRLRAAVGPGFYIVAEKILERSETLPDWPIAGTTGYDVLNDIDGLLVARDSAAEFRKLYAELTGEKADYERSLVAAKTMLIERSFGAECDNVVALAQAALRPSTIEGEFDPASFRRALEAYVVSLPVYRTYAANTELDGAGRAIVDAALADARRMLVAKDRPALDALARLIYGGDKGLSPAKARLARLRIEQLSGPVMAKSVEDTLFYRHVPMLALNEVGSSPDEFGLSRDAFDARMNDRAERWPAAMIATSTHDTKRGEDARARLLALTADARSWETTARAFLEATDGPDANDRYMLLQVLIGALPYELMTKAESAPEALDAYATRVEAFFMKALRESKRRSSWTDPDEAYEAAARKCVRDILRAGAPAFELVKQKAERLAAPGALNSLAVVILKATLPGVPDFYQGTEFWDLSLVDPDNRRPVDFDARSRSLQADEAGDLRELLPTWRDGRIKQAIIAKLLQDRSKRPELYALGDYRPKPSSSGLAFERVWRGQRLHVQIPLGTELLRSGFTGAEMPGGSVWREDKVTLSSGSWRNLLTGRALAMTGEMAAAEAAGALPWLILGADE